VRACARVYERASVCVGVCVCMRMRRRTDMRVHAGERVCMRVGARRRMGGCAGAGAGARVYIYAYT